MSRSFFHRAREPMVSHPELSSRTFSLRGPPSVASTSRRHSRNRSHYGGSSYQPQNDFPVFTHTGDVEILVIAGGREQKYLLHRLILAQCSGFFEAGTSQAWSRAQAAQGAEPRDEPRSALAVTARGEGRLRWRYELDWGDNSDGEVPMLVQKVRILRSKPHWRSTAY